MHYKIFFRVLPNLRKQIYLICLFTILKVSQPKHGFRFIVVILYNRREIARDLTGHVCRGLETNCVRVQPQTATTILKMRAG
jgi:hypothetical protein